MSGLKRELYFYFIVCWFFMIRFHIAQAVLKLSVKLRVALKLNFWSSCPHLLSAEATDVNHHTLQELYIQNKAEKRKIQSATTAKLCLRAAF